MTFRDFVRPGGRFWKLQSLIRYSVFGAAMNPQLHRKLRVTTPPNMPTISVKRLSREHSRSSYNCARTAVLAMGVFVCLSSALLVSCSLTNYLNRREEELLYTYASTSGRKLGLLQHRGIPIDLNYPPGRSITIVGV